MSETLDKHSSGEVRTKHNRNPHDASETERTPTKHKSCKLSTSARTQWNSHWSTGHRKHIAYDALPRTVLPPHPNFYNALCSLCFHFHTFSTNKIPLFYLDSLISQQDELNLEEPWTRLIRTACIKLQIKRAALPVGLFRCQMRNSFIWKISLLA